jgi:hypothetical protein
MRQGMTLAANKQGVDQRQQAARSTRHVTKHAEEHTMLQHCAMHALHRLHRLHFVFLFVVYRGYLGEQDPTGWPHTVQLGEPTCREAEALPHQ